MTLAPWRSALARALHRNRSRAYSRYLQLATLNLEGKPSNRTVVFRGFVDEKLQMVSDGRSEKIQQIQACPWAEICWYFTVTREQFRIAGELTLIGPNNELETIRINAWQAMSENAHQQFYWPHPGHARTDAKAFEPAVIATNQPPDSFSVLLLKAHRVEHLELRGNPQNRFVYEWTDGEWTVEEVNP
ncbi:MAG: pyridoxamine 5'-phosphate oxidase family protein [Leptolyngbyaceae cyanobacterium MAG.088]|nr:pyridoxamine 5'-phosphate oxidase family protein [Leptolyngbyaceae cyanobacterium MAG.088]